MKGGECSQDFTLISLLRNESDISCADLLPDIFSGETEKDAVDLVKKHVRNIFSPALKGLYVPVNFFSHVFNFVHKKLCGDKFKIKYSFSWVKRNFLMKESVGSKKFYEIFSKGNGRMKVHKIQMTLHGERDEKYLTYIISLGSVNKITSVIKRRRAFTSSCLFFSEEIGLVDSEQRVQRNATLASNDPVWNIRLTYIGEEPLGEESDKSEDCASGNPDSPDLLTLPDESNRSQNDVMPLSLETVNEAVPAIMEQDKIIAKNDKLLPIESKSRGTDSTGCNSSVGVNIESGNDEDVLGVGNALLPMNENTGPLGEEVDFLGQNGMKNALDPVGSSSEFLTSPEKSMDIDVTPLETETQPKYIQRSENSNSTDNNDGSQEKEIDDRTTQLMNTIKNFNFGKFLLERVSSNQVEKDKIGSGGECVYSDNQTAVSSNDSEIVPGAVMGKICVSAENICLTVEDIVDEDDPDDVTIVFEDIAVAHKRAKNRKNAYYNNIDVDDGVSFLEERSVFSINLGNIANQQPSTDSEKNVGDNEVDIIEIMDIDEDPEDIASKRE